MIDFKSQIVKFMCLFFPILIKNLTKMEVKRVEDYLILHGCIDKITMKISSILFT